VITFPGRNALPQPQDPKLVKLCSQLSQAQSSRIADLAKKTVPLDIDSNRVIKYAFLYATAEGQVRGDEVTKDHAGRSRLELQGALHGLSTGYDQGTEAKERYRCGRRARQQVGAALDGVLIRWNKVQQVVRKHRPNLPVYQQNQFSDENLTRVSTLLHDMLRATILDEQYVDAKEDSHWPTATAQAYLWWLAMPPYRGKWNDMYRLAVVWRMSDAQTVDAFRKVVGRIRKSVNRVRYPFGKALESILFE
jgi:hypothetical protein